MQISRSAASKNFFEGSEPIILSSQIIQTKAIKQISKNVVIGKATNPSVSLPFLKQNQTPKFLTTCQSFKPDYQVQEKPRFNPLPFTKGELVDPSYPKNKMLIIDKVVYKKASSSIKSNHSLNYSPVPKSFLVSRFKYDDLFSANKFLKNHDVTPFNKLLSVSRDSCFSVYPYLTKILKEIKKTEKFLVIKNSKSPKVYADCSCSIDKSSCFYRTKPNDQDLEKFGDGLELHFMKKVATLFNENYLVVLFEGVIGWIEGDIVKIRKGGMKFLKNIQNFFQIIVISKTPDLAAEVFLVIERKGIRISGFYIWKEGKSKEIVNLNQVFYQFSIEKPEVQVLVLASIDREVYSDELVFPLVPRLTKALNIKLCPVSNKRPPVTYLVTNLLIDPTSKVFEQLLVSLKSRMGIGYFSFLDWVKGCRGKFKVISSSLPYEIVMQNMPLKKLSNKCILHKTFIRHTEDLPNNLFVIYFD